MNDPAFEDISRETEQLLANGRVDVPVSLCFAASRGDSLLMKRLLNRGMDPNESDNSSRTPLHIATANGFTDCVHLLLEYEADVNSKDEEGSVPLWEAILGRHELIANLLWEKGANLKSCDVVSFISIAVQRGDWEMLKDLQRYGADINATNEEGSTALHLATNEGSIDAVKCLLEQGADMNKVDCNGSTPMAIAEKLGQEDLVALFQEKSQKTNSHLCIPIKDSVFSSCPDERNYREITKPSDLSEEISFHHFENPIAPGASGTQRRKRVNNFQNSLFGIVTMRSHSNLSVGGKSFDASKSLQTNSSLPTRVTIYRDHPICWKISNQSRKLILLPDSIQELLKIGGQKFGFTPVKVLNEECAEIDDIDVIRDGDRLFLVDIGQLEDACKKDDRGRQNMFEDDICELT